MKLRINVKVKPNSGSNDVKMLSNNSFEVKVTISPEKGKANKKVIELLAEYFKVPKANMSLIRGQSSRQKVFEIEK
jgi:uncharacterized protein (TIGR00251 family)